MKNRFQITEQEKKEILEQHNLFKEVLKSKSKVKRLMVNEQTTPTSGGGEEFLKAAIAVGVPPALPPATGITAVSPASRVEEFKVKPVLHARRSRSVQRHPVRSTVVVPEL